MSATLICRTALALTLLLGALPLASANCVRTGASQTEDGRTALIPFGRINLTNTTFQPYGSLLGAIAVPPTNYTYGGAIGSTVLWRCPLADLADAYFLVATNGDDRVGGFYKIEEPGLPDEVYATWFSNVGLRLSMDGVVLSRYWKAVPITSYLEQDGVALIRLSDVPVLQAEIYKIETIPPAYGAASHYCGHGAIGQPSATGTAYTCTQPNAYIQLVGKGLTHDNIGEDSAYNFRFWGADNGFGYGMRVANTLSNNASCITKFVTPSVTFPAITTVSLNAGGSVSASFNVQVECSDAVVSGTGSGQTAIGFQVSTSSMSAAQSLGLVNANMGVTALVSDNYQSDSSLAKGVGVYLNRASDGQPINLLPPFGSLAAATQTGPAAGWYPVLDTANAIGSEGAGFTTYNIEYEATLKKIPGVSVTPGKYHATATVLVRVQ